MARSARRAYRLVTISLIRFPSHSPFDVFGLSPMGNVFIRGL